MQDLPKIYCDSANEVQELDVHEREVKLPIFLILQIRHFRSIKDLLHIWHERLAVLQVLVQWIQQIQGGLVNKSFRMLLVTLEYLGKSLFVIEK